MVRTIEGGASVVGMGVGVTAAAVLVRDFSTIENRALVIGGLVAGGMLGSLVGSVAADRLA